MHTHTPTLARSLSDRDRTHSKPPYNLRIYVHTNIHAHSHSLTLLLAPSIRLGPHAFEPPYNSALLSFKLGDSQESYNLVTKALECYPEHADSKELLQQLRAKFV